MKKIPPGAEASNVLVGELEFLDRPVVAFIRLAPAVLLNGLAEVPITTRLSRRKSLRALSGKGFPPSHTEPLVSCTGFFSSCSALWEKVHSITK